MYICGCMCVAWPQDVNAGSEPLEAAVQRATTTLNSLRLDEISGTLDPEDRRLLQMVRRRGSFGHCSSLFYYYGRPIGLCIVNCLMAMQIEEQAVKMRRINMVRQLGSSSKSMAPQ